MKGIAVPYIIAIILGIAVVFIIGASFFSSSGDLQQGSCNNKLSAYCNVWQGTGYAGTGPAGGWGNYAPECTKIGIEGVDENRCKGVLGGTETARTTKKSIGADCASNAECESGNCDSTFQKCARRR